MNHKGTLETRIFSLPIPFLLFVSYNIVDDGQGKVWCLHITPFIALGFVKPKWFKG